MAVLNIVMKNLPVVLEVFSFAIKKLFWLDGTCPSKIVKPFAACD